MSDLSNVLRQGIARFLNKHGDSLLFRAVTKTRPIEVNPSADTSIHTAVPHRYLHAYLTAIKSLLRYHPDLAIFIHDDGTLNPEDKEIISRHLPGSILIERAWADQTFEKRVGDAFLSKIRSSYTSYLKLFDPTLFADHKRTIIIDTDTLFLRTPTEIIDWSLNGGPPWYHKSGPWQKHTKTVAQTHTQNNINAGPPVHIQSLVVSAIPAINDELSTDYRFIHGFNSGLVGYERGTIEYSELKLLLSHLYERFGDRIFKWGSEQTVHGLILCSKGARALPTEEYMVFTEVCRHQAPHAKFVHFIGEFRYDHFIYPILAKKVINELQQLRDAV